MLRLPIPALNLVKTNNHRMVFAMQAGLINRRVDQTKFKWGEQWNPITGYNASNPITENFAATSATTLGYWRRRFIL